LSRKQKFNYWKNPEKTARYDRIINELCHLQSFIDIQIQKNKTVIGTSLLNSKHSNNIKESEKNMYFKKFNQYMLTYVIIYDLVVLFVIPDHKKRNCYSIMDLINLQQPKKV
jgi:hypothetical protein